MQLPRFLVKMIDPGTVYMQDRSPRRPGPIFRGGAVFGPGIPGGARQATYQELVEMRAQAETARREFEGVSRRPVDPSITSHAAHELIERGTTTMHVGNRELTAHVVRFWRGECVLEITVAGAGAQSSSMSKVSRRLTTEHEPILAGYLTDALQTG
ncbi:MAG TPA: hypothetical protein VIJ07_13335 [Dermatophilaceae bacterium]|jgi:hypothetical protein